LERRLAMAEDDSDDSDDEMVNGGPSDPERAKKLLREALSKAELDDDEDDVEPKTLQSGVNGIFKGKGKATELDEDDDGIQEFVVCTLDSNQHYQQTLDITIQGDEDCFFRVVGGHTIHLTGNYILDDLSDSDEEDDEVDSEDEDVEYDTLDNMLLNADRDSEEDESEEDELDNLAHPRIMELDEDEDEAPVLVKKDKKSKKRAAEEEADAAPAKSDKKLKTNGGAAVAAGKEQPKEVDKKEPTKSKKQLKKEAKEAAKKSEQKSEQTNGKKVQFAEKLEQGPTPPKAAQGPRNVSGVMVDDKKTGTGPAAKKGDKVGMRYIGKLKDGKVFDGMSSFTKGPR
jgi:FK506-binding nuclear protein